MKRKLEKRAASFPDIVGFSTIPFRKKRKSIILPQAFDLLWEVEICSSFIAVLSLWILPDWIIFINNLLLSKFGIAVNTSWIKIPSNIIMGGYIATIILLSTWILLVWKWHYEKSSRGNQMFRNRPTREMRIHSYHTRKITIVLNDVAEVTFAVFSVLLFIMLLSYTTQIIGAFISNYLSKPWGIPDLN